jgi:ribosomal-protein-alanine N-acetyltransferase
MPADVPSLMVLERQAATAAHWSQEQYAQVFRAGAPRRLVLVIEEQSEEEQSEIRGFLAARGMGEEWEIENVVVAGMAQRRGLGTRLLEEFLSRTRAEGGTSVFLEARESNAAARALYARLAFVESGRRRAYYRDPEEDAIVYRRVFP